MSVKVRPYRGKTGGWQVDVIVRLPDGSRYRDRKRQPTSKTTAFRWGQERERHLLLHGPELPNKGVPTLEEFASRFLERHAVAEQQKPSGIESKKTILRVHLLPALGTKRLDAIRNEDVQALKSRLAEKAPKTINNVLTVFNTMLKKAIEWDVIGRMPCTIRLLRVVKPEATFHNFADYERLRGAAQGIDPRTHLIVLLAGDGGLRVGEIVALHWRDVDFVQGEMCVRSSDWRGQLTAPKNGRIRRVKMTERLATMLREHRHLRSPRVLCKDDGTPLTRQGAWSRVRYAARRARLQTGVHILRHSFSSFLAMRGAPGKAIQELLGHQDLTMTQRYMHMSPAARESAIRLLEQPITAAERGKMVETVEAANLS